MNDIHPVTIVQDRYSGAYATSYITGRRSNVVAIWIAWHCYPWEVPLDTLNSDIECDEFWREYNGDPVCGMGISPHEALVDLKNELMHMGANK